MFYRVVKLFLFIIITSLSILSCAKSNKNNHKKENILYEFHFNNTHDLDNFKVESERGQKEVSIKNNTLDIDAKNGVTVWFREKLTAPIQIEYTALVVGNDGPNDRVSDLNCFFMAIDPKCPSDIFKCPDSIRTGLFSDYHRLRTYYVGYGGHDNTKTRMRRYVGYTKERPLLKDNDLGSPYLIEANKEKKVEIKVQNNNITYAIDGKVIFEMNDTIPYHEGWFAFRTVRNHMKIQDFKIKEL